MPSCGLQPLASLLLTVLTFMFEIFLLVSTCSVMLVLASEELSGIPDYPVHADPTQFRAVTLRTAEIMTRSRHTGLQFTLQLQHTRLFLANDPEEHAFIIG